MSLSANPPPQKLPASILQDQESRVFFQSFIRSSYLIWERVGRGLKVSGLVGLYGNTPIDQGAALTASDTNTPNSGDVTTDAIIANLQTRVDELEARLNTSTGIGVIL